MAQKEFENLSYFKGSQQNPYIKALIQENESLKDLLSRTLGISTEVQSLHQKNRNLTSQLVSSQQQNETLQKRLQLLQQSFHDSQEIHRTKATIYEPPKVNEEKSELS
jgi:predicted RNase H-like nuclease (RuvC/YqgF family)